MSTRPPEHEPSSSNRMIDTVRRRRTRHRAWELEGKPSVARFVGQIGVLGWVIVAPTLIGLFLGRWLDQRLGTGVLWSAPLLLIGAIIGFWSAWRWMHSR